MVHTAFQRLSGDSSLGYAEKFFITDSLVSTFRDGFHCPMGGLPVTTAHHIWMQAFVEQTFCVGKQGASQNRRRRRAVVAHALLGVCCFYNHLRTGVADVKLLQDGSTIVGDDDIATAVYHHFVHTRWAQSGPHRIGNGLCCSDVHALCCLLLFV